MIVGYDLPGERIDPKIKFGPPHDLNQLNKILEESDHVYVIDHAGSVVPDQLTKCIFDVINDAGQKLGRKIHVHHGGIGYLLNLLGNTFRSRLSNLIFYDNYVRELDGLVSPLYNFNIHKDKHFKNFLISFNGTAHVSRKLLVSALHRRGWFDPQYSTKNLSYTADEIDGHIKDLVGEKEVVYRKFFSIDDEDFNHSIISHHYDRYAHLKNIENLDLRLSESFVHVVSESIATTYTSPSEKYFYGIATRSLFLAYAGPFYHRYSAETLGFRLYDTLFDYRFDTIVDPVDRLIELLCMLSKYSCLSPADWHDLYLLEYDNIEYNYDNFFSKRFENHYIDFLENLIAKEKNNG
jgi:hypothetical protein